MQQSVTYVLLLKVGHVDERDALQVNAQHEHVAREGEGRASVEAEPPYVAYRVERYCALWGLGEACEYVAEDVVVGGKAHVGGLAVERAQGA